jgi:hypothetical protein
VKFFGREQRKTFAHRVSALMTENTDGAGSGTVAFSNAFIQHALQQIEILFHYLFCNCKKQK